MHECMWYRVYAGMCCCDDPMRERVRCCMWGGCRVKGALWYRVYAGMCWRVFNRLVWVVNVGGSECLCWRMCGGCADRVCHHRRQVVVNV